MKDKPNLVIGAGITGITIARQLAERDEKVLLIEKRNHIGGNCYDFFTADGQYIQKYGPHIFHTKDGKIWDFFSRFAKFNNYQHKVLACVDGKLMPVPFNFNSLKIAFPESIASRIKKKVLEKIGANKSVSLLEMRKSKDKDLRILADFVYNKIFLNYTIKQWDLRPEEIDPQVINRVPIFTGMDDRYFPNDKYQGIPVGGYTAMFNRMLKHKNIKVSLRTNYKKIKDFSRFRRVIVTSPLDEFFSYKFGKIAYRKILLRFEEHDSKSFQESAVVNYPNDYKYTRITEYNKFLHLKKEKTTISKEFPSWDRGFVAYPLLTKKNSELLKRYFVLAPKNVYFAGRLAECKYYNMDQACIRAIDLVKKMR